MYPYERCSTQTMNGKQYRISWLQLPAFSKDSSKTRYWTSRMKNLIIFKCYYHSTTCLFKTVLYHTNNEHSLAGCCRLSLSISPHHVILVFGRFVRNVLVSKLSVCCRVNGCMVSKRFSVLGTSFGSEPKPPWKTYQVIRRSGWTSGNVFGRDHVQDWRYVRPM